MKKKLILSAAVVAVVAAVAAPLGSGHAVVSAIQPQGKLLTAQTTTYVLRVPNEKAAQSTFKVIMTVPDAVQTAISVRTMADWDITLDRVDTGQKNASGEPIYAIKHITWRSAKGKMIKPGFYSLFEFRFRNPSTPQSLCFATDQWYNGPAKGTPAELVSWSGAANTATPASCINIVDS